MKIIKVHKRETLVKIQKFLEKDGIKETNVGKYNIKILPDFVNFWSNIPNKLVYIAIDENENVIGTIGGVFMAHPYDIREKYFYNYFLVISPEHRNKNMGSRLVSLIEKEAKDNGMKYIITASPSELTTEFYKKYGFNYFETILIKEVI